MKALITGAAGQDGYFLAQLLAEHRVEFTATSQSMANFPADHPARVGEVAELDVTDSAQVRKVIQDSGPDVIFHLAGLSSVGDSWEDSAAYLTVNAVGTCNVLVAAQQLRNEDYDPIQVIHASSCEIFDEQAVLPLTESTPLHPLNPYGVSKAAAHGLVQTYRAEGLNAVNAILFNHESHLRPPKFVTGKIARGVARIKAGRSDSFSLGNLNARRDWLHASDVAEALLAIAAQKAEGDFVIASGVSRTVADFVAAAFASVGIPNWQDYVKVDQTLLRATDAPELRGDSSRLAAVTGWRPKREFHEWVAEMVALADIS